MEPLLAAFLAEAKFAQSLLMELVLLHGRIMLLLLACCALVRLTERWAGNSAANRHTILCLGLLCTLILPLSSQWLPAYNIVVEVTVPIIASALPAALSSAVESSSADALPPSVIYLALLGAYAVVTAMALARVMLSIGKVFLQTHLSHDVEQRYWTEALASYRQNLHITREVALKHAGHIHSPMTCGIRRPVILLPSCALHWPDHLIASALLHELAHIKRNDWLTQQLARCICALYWVNPFCWKAFNNLSLYAEKASDHMALHAGVEKTHYASDLLTVAEHLNCHTHSRAALAMAVTKKPSQLCERVNAVLNFGERHAPLTKTQMATVLLVVVAIFLPLTSLRANYIEKVIFIITYPHADTETASLVLPEQKPPSPQQGSNERGYPSLEEIRREVFAEFDLPSSFEEASNDAEPQQELVVEATENTLEPADILERAINSITELNKSQTDRKIGQIAALTETTHEKYAIEPAQADATQPQGELTATPQPVGLKPLIEQPQARRMVIPKYPLRAARRGIEGKIIVEYDLDQTGKVVAAQIVSASPENIFDKYVLKAIKKSEFIPKKINGKAVAAEGLRERYVFVLES